jgi:osmotically-inducible protein OsmY
MMANGDWDRERDWERGRRYRGQGYYGGYYGYPPERERERDYGRRGEDRGFWDRAGDEVRSWFGDEDASRRRVRDEREGGGWRDPDWWPGRDRESAREREDERRWRRGGDSERDWARQWGYVEGRGGGGEQTWPRGWGYSGGYGAGAGYLGGRGEWSTGAGGYEPGGYGFTQDRGRYDYDAERARRAMRGPHSGRGPRGYQRSDERIREDVCERMCDSGDLDASDIEVRVSNAEVTLLGTVRERQDKRLAEDLVEQVSGVREVHNQLRASQGGAGQESQPGRPFRAA